MPNRNYAITLTGYPFPTTTKTTKRLIWITIAIAIIVAVAGIIGGRDLRVMIETAIALSVAAVPEGLPIVATVALARGMWRMAKRNAIINRLSAVETLGATSIICTDKTGTLTENRMSVTQIALDTGKVEVTGEEQTQGKFNLKEETIDPLDNPILRKVLEVSVLCNNASLPQNNSKHKAVGDPTEVALLAMGAKAGLHRDELLEQQPEVREDAFDSETKMMATFHEVKGKKYRVAVKGAPESVLPVCADCLTTKGIKDFNRDTHQSWQSQCDRLAQAGLRILAIAEKTVADSEVKPYEKLTFLTTKHWWAIALYGLLIAVTVLAAFYLALIPLNFDAPKAVTISFLTLAYGRLWHVFNMRDAGSGLLRNEISTNPYIWGALLICTGLLLSAVYLPGLYDALQTVNPGVNGWGLAIAMSFIPVIVGQIVKETR